MGIAQDGTKDDHPLIISLVNTAEPPFPVNRSVYWPSHQHADINLRQAVALCRSAEFQKVAYWGDTDFSQTRHLDRWNADCIRFISGRDARANLVGLAEHLNDLRYSELKEPPRCRMKTAPRPTTRGGRGPTQACRPRGDLP